VCFKHFSSQSYTYCVHTERTLTIVSMLAIMDNIGAQFAVQ